MTSVPAAPELIHLGMDTSVNEIVVAVLRSGQEIPVVDRIPGDEESVRRVIGRFPDRRLLSACHEAGPVEQAERVLRHVVQRIDGGGDVTARHGGHRVGPDVVTTGSLPFPRRRTSAPTGHRARAP